MFPKDIEVKIGFDSVREWLMKACLSPMGTLRAEKMGFSTHLPSIELWLNQTSEFKQILEEDDQFPTQNYHDITPVIKKLEIDGMYLTENELHQLAQIQTLIDSILLFFKKKQEKYPVLNALYTDTSVNKHIAKIIDAVLDEMGKIKPSASPELLKISNAISKSERDIHRQLNSIFKKVREEGWAGETNISIREGRLVIPIIAEHKRKIKGLVHDESASGKILYMEPTEIVESNNALRHLYFEKNRETERILREVSAKLRPFLPDMENYLKKISLTDFIRAKAMVALKLQAIKPKLNQQGELRLRNAYHPNLYVRLKKQGQEPVALDLDLNPERHIMVISGPNAGGKSVALKTIAINQYMLQCGMLVCATPDSSFPLFKDMMVDIGDGQSIDNNLSSYSAHLSAMKHFVNRADKHTLFFIDELGSGTDPQFGGAIGEAVLEKLNANKAYGVVTTHFSNIKNYAGQTEGFMNGSMLYDKVKYEPLYKLLSGKPGSSFAIELAIKTGLNKEIIEKAKKRSGKDQNRLEEILSEYEKDARDLKEKEKRISDKEALLNKLLTEYNDLKQKISAQKTDILNKAKSEAKTILDSTNQLIEKTIREIKTANAEPVITKAIRKKIEDKKAEIEPEVVSTSEKTTKPKETQVNAGLEIGNLVKIKGFESLGKVLQIGKEKALVEMGLIKTRLDLDQLEKINPAKHIKPSTRIKGYNYRQISEEFSPRLDVRGLSTEEALRKTMDLVDNALVLSIDKLWILHGKGDGILRKMIRENLKKTSHVIGIESEHVDFGGDGITIVTLG